MKICIAQTKSWKGDIKKNIENHLRIIDQATELKASLIVFPELSITGYEPEMAKELVCEAGDTIFDPFQEVANQKNAILCIGAPTNTEEGVQISMLIFQPNAKRLVYSKQLLHTDELPYFVIGKEKPFLNINEKTIALGICYETLQREHFENAIKNDAKIYIASVAKPDRGLEKAYLHFPSIAKEFGVPILMANCIGYCDNFLSNGQSSVWNHEGKLMGQLDQENQGILIYDTELDIAESFQTNN